MTFKNGDIPWNRGKKTGPRSEETRRKISVALMGKKLSEEHKNKLSIAKKGKRRAAFSEEHRRKLSESHKGKTSPFYGRKHTKESRYKMSIICKGRRHTEETKEKLRAFRLDQVFPKRDTSIETALHSELDNRGIIYEKHVSVCGICQPDIVFPNKMVAVFADGIYWHSKEFKNGKVWRRDRRQDKVLGDAGWSVLRFWGTEIRGDVSLCVDKIEGILD